MFDVNLLGKPGIQPKVVNTSHSFLDEMQKEKVDTKYKPVEKKSPAKSRIKSLIIIGLIVTGLTAICLMYLLPLINPIKSIEKPNYNLEISQNEIVSGLIDLLLNNKLNQKIDLIEFNIDEINIIYNKSINQKIKELGLNDFYGINIRAKIYQDKKLNYIYRIPWFGRSNPINQEFSNIKKIIGERFILSNSYDFKTDTFSLIVNEYKNIVSILLRLHDADILTNFNIKIQSGPDEFSTISLKPF
ncbi:MAG: hypothetical protein H8E60_03825 [Candidatus Marinimicrobia bacterium]|nr:hypothetical protein [Candidatus Neomarinimicrobiota bacterium]